MKKMNVLHDIYRSIYLLMLMMHPRAFREEFSTEMDLDFADAMRDGHQVLFYKDGLVSLARQWMMRATGPHTQTQMAGAPCLLSGRYGMIDADRLTPWELLRGMVVSAALIGGLAMVPAHAVKSLTSPTNAAGMRGEVPGGTGAMSRGGDSDQSAGRKVYERTAFGTRAATPVEVSADPASVAETTAAVLRGIPSQSGAPAGTMLVATRKFSAFDVASVRENRSGGETSMNFPLGPTDYGYAKSGGVFRVRNFTLAGYIAFAYKLNVYQNTKMRIQLPEWARSTHYDIEARVDGEPSKDDMRVMMQALLADRFKLKVHRESHEMAVMDLEMIKPGKTGPGLVAHAADDPECKQNVPHYFSPCGLIGATPGAVVKVAGRNVTLADLADFSGSTAGRPVIDKTGLMGKWDMTLDFVPDATPRPDGQPEAAGPTFIEALKEQMGLKMVPGQGMVETVVLDGVERPKEN